MRLLLVLSVFSFLFATIPLLVHAQTVEIEGAVKISQSASTPDSGTIRWTQEDFEGYNGERWLSLTGQPSSGTIDSGKVKDVDGNVYNTIVIDSVEWMVENLRTTTLNDGTKIPYAPNPNVWKQLNKTGAYAYCWYEDDEPYYAFPYGALYNWYAVETEALCPDGWHVPSDTDWDGLVDSLGGASSAGGALKSTGDLTASDGLWNSPNSGATNSSGFTGYPGGARFYNGSYFEMNNAGFWWSTTAPSDSTALYRWLMAEAPEVARDTIDKRLGMSVRCVKD